MSIGPATTHLAAHECCCGATHCAWPRSTPAGRRSRIVRRRVPALRSRSNWRAPTRTSTTSRRTTCPRRAGCARRCRRDSAPVRLGNRLIRRSKSVEGRLPLGGSLGRGCGRVAGESAILGPDPADRPGVLPDPGHPRRRHPTEKQRARVPSPPTLWVGRWWQSQSCSLSWRHDWRLPTMPCRSRKADRSPRSSGSESGVRGTQAWSPPGAARSVLFACDGRTGEHLGLVRTRLERLRGGSAGRYERRSILGAAFERLVQPGRCVRESRRSRLGRTLSP